MLVYLFPGQGSQHRGMGGELFGRFKALTEEADAILGYSIEELCLRDPRGLLANTAYTQPALYVVNALTYLSRVETAGRRPDFAAGHSLGEYSALFAAGAFDFGTGLRLVQRRGALMAEAPEGAMAAVIGLPLDRVHDVLAHRELGGIDVANYNSPTQTVISGPKSDIARAQSLFESAGAGMYIPLNVSGPFHSRYMKEARESFERFMQPLAFREPSITVISNVEAQPYETELIKAGLGDQMTSPVRWTDSVRYLLELGGDPVLEEVGPGNVLTKLVRAIRQDFDANRPPSHAAATADDPAYTARMETAAAIAREDRARAEQARTSGSRDARSSLITAESLGDPAFKADYRLKYAYMAGAMYKGISSASFVVKCGRAGILGIFGAGGLGLSEVDQAIADIQSRLGEGEPYGFNLLHQPGDFAAEEALVRLYAKRGVSVVEASSFLTVTRALVWYKAKGLLRDENGRWTQKHKIIAKVTRPEVAEAFMSPAPGVIIQELLREGLIAPGEAEGLRSLPVADDVIALSDSGGHTDQGATAVLLPAIARLRDELSRRYGYAKRIRVGAGGGIGTPEAAAAAFMLGADFIATGSINQCTAEAAASGEVKELLTRAQVQDMAYAPSASGFENGAKVQVAGRGTFFPYRADKLAKLYEKHESLESIDEKTREAIQAKYLKRSFSEAFEAATASATREETARAERDPKARMALVFKWYLDECADKALKGDPDWRTDYQIFCGPALGAFNQWVRGTEFEAWSSRHVDQLGMLLMREAAEWLNRRFAAMTGL
ncbi:ACP S-malonyltransferase [Paenibacillus methanolicus]|uniref:[acyl-carrier-protein] S-malonyltransferase n=1 Tax=Paenibacillus methanolicus TaxID=582686 RepID=A0A5S5CHR1_9BACL|nr:ACP S-malonyltransferase [Paenibacillus methanolicus]TYP78148.1 trans-AT polyketide synthase/acyltransferase/oxidoreductase domain-containing protein [Paenibacillus methanolicus]